MSKWRAKALELFPEIRINIQKADSLGAFWIELISEYQSHTASECTRPQEFGPEAFMYAEWCDASSDWRTREVAGIEFFQSIIPLAFRSGKSTYANIVRELFAFFGLPTIENRIAAFGYALSSEQLSVFLEDAEEAGRKINRRQSKRQL